MELPSHQAWKQITYHIIAVLPLHLRKVNTTVVRFPPLFPFFILAGGEEKENNDKQRKHFRELTGQGNLHHPKSWFMPEDCEWRVLVRSPAAGAVLGFLWQENQAQSPVNIRSQLGGVYKPILFSLWTYLADSSPLNMPDAEPSLSPPWTCYVWNATFLLDSNTFKAHPFKTQERASYIVYKKSSYIPLCFILLPSLPPASYLPHTPWKQKYWSPHLGSTSW